jgi:hypothetical protein
LGFKDDAECARHLLKRLKGDKVPFCKEYKMVLDSVNALIFGLEGSRNNLTYLTAIMALEMVIEYQFDFHTAFACAGLFKRQDGILGTGKTRYITTLEEVLEPIYHNIDNLKSPHQYDKTAEPVFRGGVFPMATFGSGGGHFKARREALQEAAFLKDDQYDWSKTIATWSNNLQFYGVPVKELDLILCLLKRKVPTLGAMKAFDAMKMVESLFNEKIQEYYPKKAAAPALNIQISNNNQGTKDSKEEVLLRPHQRTENDRLRSFLPSWSPNSRLCGRVWAHETYETHETEASRDSEQVRALNSISIPLAKGQTRFRSASSCIALSTLRMICATVGYETTLLECATPGSENARFAKEDSRASRRGILLHARRRTGSTATKGESPRIGGSQLWRDQCLMALRQHRSDVGQETAN